MQNGFFSLSLPLSIYDSVSRKDHTMTLVILAAGLGSRYGGLKQIDPITEHGEFIIDFSIYDAIEAGFDRVVFLIKKENTCFIT